MDGSFLSKNKNHPSFWLYKKGDLLINIAPQAENKYFDIYQKYKQLFC